MINHDSIFLIGCGFTRAVVPSAPLNDELFDMMVARKSDSSLRKLEKYQSEPGFQKNIEIALSLLHLAAYSEGTSQSIAKKDLLEIESELCDFFSQFTFNKNKHEQPWIGNLATRILRKGALIVDLNYDCVLDAILDEYEFWTPNGGYLQIGANFGVRLPKNPENILLLKIHGSCHFVTNDVAGGNSTINLKYENAFLPRSRSRLTELGYDELSTGVNPSSYIIGPSFVKRPHAIIEELMIYALRAAASANNLVIIGCSVRTEDVYLWLLLTAFLNSEKKRIIIVDPNPEAIKNRLNSHWSSRNQQYILPIPRPLESESTIDLLDKALSA